MERAYSFSFRYIKGKVLSGMVFMMMFLKSRVSSELKGLAVQCETLKARSITQSKGTAASGPSKRCRLVKSANDTFRIH